MRYTTEVIINLPRARVIELFDDSENLKKWQPGLESFKHVSGTPGQPGAKSKLLYKTGKREIELIETITSRNLPDEFSGTYEASGVFNTLINRFYEDGPDKTRWVTDSEFKFSGLMMIMTLLMRGSFRKQTCKTMEGFKNFAENA